MNGKDFKTEFETLTKKYLTEDHGSAFDFILANYLDKCMQTFNLAIKQIDRTVETAICGAMHDQ